MGVAGQDRLADAVRKPGEALRRELLHLRVGIVKQGKEHAREIDRRQGQGAPGCHQPRIARGVAARVALGLGRERELDLLRLGLHRNAPLGSGAGRLAARGRPPDYDVSVRAASASAMILSRTCAGTSS